MDQLFALQDVDAGLWERSHKLSILEESSGARAAADVVKLLRMDLKSMNSRIATLVVRRDELDGRSRDLMAKVKNIKAKEMSGAISHRDFATTEAEISHLETQRSELEDAEFEVLSEIEQIEFQIQEVQQKLLVRDAELSELKAANANVVAVIKNEVADLEGKRSELTGVIDGSLLKTYDGIRLRVGSMTLARIENSNCQGCRLKLSSVEIESVKRVLAGEFSRPPTCEQCGRMLYI